MIFFAMYYMICLEKDISSSKDFFFNLETRILLKVYLISKINKIRINSD